MDTVSKLYKCLLVLCLTLTGCGLDKKHDENIKHVDTKPTTTPVVREETEVVDQKETEVEKDGVEIVHEVVKEVVEPTNGETKKVVVQKEHKIENKEKVEENIVNDKEDTSVKSWSTKVVENKEFSTLLNNVKDLSSKKNIASLQEAYGYNDAQMKVVLPVVCGDDSTIRTMIQDLDAFQIDKVVDLSLERVTTFNNGKTKTEQLKGDGNTHTYEIAISNANPINDYKAFHFNGVYWESLFTVAHYGYVTVDLDNFSPVVVMHYTTIQDSTDGFHPFVPDYHPSETIQPTEKPVEKEPVKKVNIESTSSEEGTTCNLSVTIDTEGVEDSKEVVVEFMDENGKVIFTEKGQPTDNKVTVTFALSNGLKAGKYKIKASVDGKSKEVEYTITEHIAPTLEKPTIDVKTMVAGSKQQVVVSGSTKDMKDGTTVDIKVVDSSLKDTNIKASATVKDNQYKETITFDETITAGKYYIVVSMEGSKQSLEFEVSKQANTKKGLKYIQYNEYGKKLDIYTEGYEDGRKLTIQVGKTKEETPLLLFKHPTHSFARLETNDEKEPTLQEETKEVEEAVEEKEVVEAVVEEETTEEATEETTEQTTEEVKEEQETEETSNEEVTEDEDLTVKEEPKEEVEEPKEQEVVEDVIQDKTIEVVVNNNHAVYNLENLTVGKNTIKVISEEVEDIDLTTDVVVKPTFTPKEGSVVTTVSDLTVTKGEAKTIVANMKTSSVKDGPVTVTVKEDPSITISGKVKTSGWLLVKTTSCELKVPATLEEGTYTLELEFSDDKKEEIQLLVVEKEEPCKLVGISIDRDEVVEKSDESIEITVDTTKTIGTPKVEAYLVDQEGSKVSGVSETSYINGSKAVFDLELNDNVTEGSYQVVVKLNGATMEKPLTVTHKIAPVVKAFEMNPTEVMELSNAEVTINATCVDMSDGDIIEVELLNEDKSVLTKRLVKELEVKDNTATGVITIGDDVRYGNYVMRVSNLISSVEQPFVVKYKGQPKFVETVYQPLTITHGYAYTTDFKLKTEDIPEFAKLKVKIAKEDGTEVEQVKESELVENSSDDEYRYYTYEIPEFNLGEKGETEFVHPYKIVIRFEDAETSVDFNIHDGDSSWDEVLDYSIQNDEFYWFDEFNKPYAYTDANAPYDPNKPVMIFIHGWQSGSVKENYGQDFNYIVKDENGGITMHNSAKAWIDAGYNVGAYNWVQIADEDGGGASHGVPYRAEGKIWTTEALTSNMTNMRYRLSGGEFLDDSSNLTAAEKFVLKYEDVLKDFKGDYIELGGHSLGNQMALRSSYLILQDAINGKIDKTIVPDRVDLFDPYYCGNKHQFVTVEDTENLTIAQAGAKIAKVLANNNIVIQMFKSSSLTTNSLACDINYDLEKAAFFNRMWPNVLGITYTGFIAPETAKHSAGYRFYYWAKHHGNDYYIKDNAYVASLMGDTFKEEQVAGQNTVSVEDDRGVIKALHPYIAPTAITLTNLAKEEIQDHTTLTVSRNDYVKVNAIVEPANASNKVVLFDKVSGDRDCVQMAYDGWMKGVKQGTVTIKAYILVLNDDGSINSSIERYFNVTVE